MNRSETIWKLEELTGSHEEETCSGCGTCTEIANLRDKLFYNQKVADTLAKGPEMTKSDIEFLLGKDVQLKEIRKSIGMGGNGFTALMQSWGFSKRRGDSEMSKLKDFTVDEYLAMKNEMKLNDEKIAEKKEVSPPTLTVWKKANGLIGVAQRKAFVTKKKPNETNTPQETKQPPQNEHKSLVATLKREKEVMEKGIAQYKEEIENLKVTTVPRSKYNDLETDYKESEYERVKNYEEFKKMEEAYHKEHAALIHLDAEVENLREQLKEAREESVKYGKENEYLWGLLKIKMEG